MQGTSQKAVCGRVVHTKTQVLQHCDTDLVDKPRYTLQYIVTDKAYVVEITHIRSFYFGPAYITQLNIVVKDTDETVVEMRSRATRLLVSNPQDKKWLVR